MQSSEGKNDERCASDASETGHKSQLAMFDAMVLIEVELAETARAASLLERLLGALSASHMAAIARRCRLRLLSRGALAPCASLSVVGTSTWCSLSAGSGWRASCCCRGGGFGLSGVTGSAGGTLT